MLKGYEEENLKLIKKQKDHDGLVKELTIKLMNEQKLVKEYKLKSLKEKSGVYVEDNDADGEVDMQTKNVMGDGQSIS